MVVWGRTPSYWCAVCCSCRSLGDFAFKHPQALISADPYVAAQQLTPADRLVVMTSDGVTDVLPDDDMLEVAIRAIEQVNKGAGAARTCCCMQCQGLRCQQGVLSCISDSSRASMVCLRACTSTAATIRVEHTHSQLGVNSTGTLQQPVCPWCQRCSHHSRLKLLA